MVALLGPPPGDFLKRSEYAPEFFDEQGVLANYILAVDGC
jgi:hypothetical protein